MKPETAIVPVTASRAIEPVSALHSAEDVAVAFLLGYSGRTRESYGADLRVFFAWCADHGTDPLAAARAHVDAFARHLAENEHRSPATVARRLSALSGFYRYAVDEELIARNPVSAVRRPKVGSDSQSTGLDKDELIALLDAAEADGPRTHALVLLLGLNGLRVSEAVGASLEDLGTERGHRVLKIVRKGGKRQTVPLAPKVADAIDRLTDGRTSGPIFATNTGKPMDRHAVWRTLRRLARVAVPEKAATIHPHDLRHAFVTLSLDAEVSLRHVQDAAGHADPRTTRRYDTARNNLDKHPTYALAALVG